MVRQELPSTFLGCLANNPLAAKNFSRDTLLLSCWAQAKLLTPPESLQDPAGRPSPAGPAWWPQVKGKWFCSC